MNEKEVIQVLKLRSIQSLIAFSCCVTLLALVLAQSLNYLLYPEEILERTLRGTTIIVLVVSIPISLFVGVNIRRNSLLGDELKRLLSRDRLTDVATRDFFFGKLKKDGDAYGVSLMVDIDHFKTVNDTYGHPAGDVVIRHVAQILKENCRPMDIVCRFGGEEFVIFLQQATLETGNFIAERIRQQVQEQPALAEGIEISVTVSIGGSLKEAAADVDASIKLADEALYRAKALGRNQIVVPNAA